MRCDPVAFTLRDGRAAVIRLPEEADAQEVLLLLYETAKETHFLIGYPEEAPKSLEMEAELLADMPDNPYQLLICCEVDGEIAAMAHLLFNRKEKIRHRAELGIRVRKRYWGQGIAARMMTVLMDEARKREGLRQIELDYMEGNDRAKRLYERMGFREVAVMPAQYRLRDGTLLDGHHMQYLLSTGEQDENV